MGISDMHLLMEALKAATVSEDAARRAGSADPTSVSPPVAHKDHQPHPLSGWCQKCNLPPSMWEAQGMRHCDGVPTQAIPKPAPVPHAEHSETIERLMRLG